MQVMLHHRASETESPGACLDHLRANEVLTAPLEISLDYRDAVPRGLGRRRTRQFGGRVRLRLNGVYAGRTLEEFRGRRSATIHMAPMVAPMV